MITLIFTIIEIVTQYYGEYCSNSFSPNHAHLWLFLAGILIVAGALEATGAFAKRMKSEMTGTHKERAKIYSFLGIIFFQIIQGVSVPHRIPADLQLSFALTALSVTFTVDHPLTYH